MVTKRSLEEVLHDLKEAEKEYKEKCLKYGITEKHARKKQAEETAMEESIEEDVQTQEVQEEVISEN